MTRIEVGRLHRVIVPSRSAARNSRSPEARVRVTRNSTAAAFCVAPPNRSSSTWYAV